MALASSMAKFKSEFSESTSRNVSASRPSAAIPQRTSAPANLKRSHDSLSQPSEAKAVPVRGELMSHVIFATEHLKEKFPNTVSFDDILAYLSLPVDLQKHKSAIKLVLQQHHRVTYVPKSSSSKETFRYNPTHPVASTDDLIAYLQQRTSFAGIPVKELKDVWPDCVPELDKLEQQHKILIIRNRKDNTPRTIWPDVPQLHTHEDSDFIDFWMKTKLPSGDSDVRNELEKAGIVPTSEVRLNRKTGPQKKEKRKINRASNKFTNTHMRGLLKDYSKR